MPAVPIVAVSGRVREETAPALRASLRARSAAPLAQSAWQTRGRHPAARNPVPLSSQKEAAIVCCPCTASFSRAFFCRLVRCRARAELAVGHGPDADLPRNGRAPLAGHGVALHAGRPGRRGAHLRCLGGRRPGGRPGRLGAFPLDGGRVLRSALWGATGSLRRATYWAALLGQAFAWFLILVGVAHFFTGHIFHGVWLGLIGLFLKDAAQGSYRQVLVRQMHRGEPVSRFMTADPVAVPPALDLRQWVEDYVYRFHRKAFPVVSGGRLEGFITTHALAKWPREEWDRHTIAEVMRRDLRPVSVAPDADALEALGKMEGTGSSRLLVVEGDRLLGIVSLKDLLRFLNLKIELGVEGERPERSEQHDRGRSGRPTGFDGKVVPAEGQAREHARCH